MTGKTVLSAIHAAQLENVHHLLRTTTLSISEIGTLYHFRSESQLQRLFKATYGMTMSAARQDLGEARNRAGANPDSFNAR